MKEIQKHEESNKSRPKADKGSAQSSALDSLPAIMMADRILHLQLAIGNRAVTYLLQPKLKIGQPGDEYEQEADRVAARVSTLSHAPGQVVQRKCSACSSAAPCSECLDKETETIQRKKRDATSLSSTDVRIQRAPLNGESNAGASTPNVSNRPHAAASPARSLIVEDESVELQPGQMRKSDFLAQLRAAVCSTADEALASAGRDTRGCPYIEQGFARYAEYPASYLQRAVK